MMKYQLVFQKVIDSEVDFDEVSFDELLALEARMEAFIAHGAIVDGHDFGAGEGNIFILTDHPKIIFQQIFGYLLNDEEKAQLKVAFRDLKEEDYQILWPDSDIGTRNFDVK